MSLRIGQFVTTCHLPRPYAGQADVVDRVAKGRLATDLEEYLGPSLTSTPGIVRIRYLPMRVVIPAKDLNEDSLALAWTQEFGRALFTAIAYPAGAGPVEIFRAESLAAFLAGAIRGILNGTSASQWQYAEFEDFFRLGGTPAALALLCNWPLETMAILMELADGDALERVLARFDEVMLERLCEVLAGGASKDSPQLSAGDVLTTARLVQARPPEKASALRSRRYALLLFVQRLRAGETGSTPRVLFHGLLTLALLLDRDLLPGGALRGESDLGTPLAPLVALVQQLRRELQDDSHLPDLIQLRQLLQQLRVELRITEPAILQPEALWISSDYCGLFFLSSTLDRLGWIPAWRALTEFRSGGISPLLAGVALAVLEKFHMSPSALDAGIALFCGFVEEPGRTRFDAAFKDYPQGLCLTVLDAAVGQSEGEPEWPEVFERLAAHLLRAFASQIRGFRQATRRSVVHTFLERPGRIRIEQGRIVVIPEPSPFHVALHIAGLDAPMGSLSWLGERRLEFELGDL